MIRRESPLTLINPAQGKAANGGLMVRHCHQQAISVIRLLNKVAAHPFLHGTDLKTLTNAPRKVPTPRIRFVQP
jgi:hypothetical protein